MASDERAAVLVGTREGDDWTLDEVRSALASQGLHVVTAAQMRVLEASSQIVVDNLIQISERNGKRMARWARAELELRNGQTGPRREAEK